MKFVNSTFTANVKIDNNDLIYNKGDDRLGFIKDIYGNIYQPLFGDIKINSLRESSIDISLIAEKWYLTIESKVEGRWRKLSDFFG